MVWCWCRLASGCSEASVDARGLGETGTENGEEESDVDFEIEAVLGVGVLNCYLRASYVVMLFEDSKGMMEVNFFIFYFLCFLDLG
jgi:hypothetical protein